MIDFDALRVFVVVVECGGFNAASLVLFKSQPAVTASVKKLEEQLDLVLFDRSHYRPVLTTQGEQFYQRAKSLVGHWQHLNQFADQLKASVESDIRIAIDVFYPLATLKDLFHQWIVSYPNTQFHFISESLGGACERLVQHQVDIIISENLICQQAVEVVLLRTEPMIAVAAPEFVAHFSAELAQLDTLSACMQVILRDSSKSDLSFGVIEHGRHWTVSDVLSKKEIIMAGLGWGRLPYHLIATELADGRLQRLVANHFDERLINLQAIRLQKPSHGPIATKLWEDLNTHTHQML